MYAQIPSWTVSMRVCDDFVTFERMSASSSEYDTKIPSNISGIDHLTGIGWTSTQNRLNLDYTSPTIRKRGIRPYRIPTYIAVIAVVKAMYRNVWTYTPSLWSGRRDSNPQHSAWEADALPIELRPHNTFQISIEYTSHVLISTNLSGRTRESKWCFRSICTT